MMVMVGRDDPTPSSATSARSPLKNDKESGGLSSTAIGRHQRLPTSSENASCNLSSTIMEVMLQMELSCGGHVASSSYS